MRLGILICSCVLAFQTQTELKATHYVGEAFIDENFPNRFQSVSFSSTRYDWTAYSVDETPKMTASIQRVFRRRHPVELAYLPSSEDIPGIRQLQEIVDEEETPYYSCMPFYRSCILKRKDDDTTIGYMEIHRMPRAVKYPEEQDRILNFYQGKGLMTYDPDNIEEELVGKYRSNDNGPIIDGQQYGLGIARIRLLLGEEKVTGEEITDILGGGASYIRALSEKFPLHSYWSDKSPAVPHLVMSYTEQGFESDPYYKNAGFSVEYNKVFREYYPPELRKFLPKKPSVKTLFMSAIPPERMHLEIIYH